MNKKRFGRWAEGCVARAFRDRSYYVRTQEGMTLIPYRDMIVEMNGTEFDVQVKATNATSNAGAFFRMHWRKLKEYVEGARERERRFVLVVVNTRKAGGIFVFPDKYLRGVVELAEQDIGLHYSRPGLLMLEYEDAARSWDLTIGELAEGRRIALDDAVDAPDMFDDLLQ
jgi:hypothetical protein